MGCVYRCLVFCRNNSWIMENMDTEDTIPKWVLIVWPKLTQMPQNISAQNVCPSPKKFSLGVRSSWSYWLFHGAWIERGSMTHKTCGIKEYFNGSNFFKFDLEGYFKIWNKKDSKFFFSLKNIKSGAQLLLLTLFAYCHFWSTLFTKIGPKLQTLIPNQALI